MSVVAQKLHHFLAKDTSERRKIIRNRLQRWFGFFHFRLKPRVSTPTYVAYHPDSFFIEGLHPEFQSLIKNWLYENEINNGGDVSRLHALMLNIKQILDEGIPGDFAELGVWRGNSAAVLAHYASAANRRVFLYDTFEGFDDRDLEDVDASKAKNNFSNTSLALVKKNVGHEATTRYVVGYFPESLTEEARTSQYAFVHIDCDLYKPMRDALNFFYPRLAPGGIIFMHDYSSGYWDGAKKAIDEFSKTIRERLILMPDKSGTAVIRKAAEN